MGAMRFDNSYARLPDRFFTRQPATPVAAPRLLKANHALARDLGMDPAWLDSPAGVAALAGNAVPEGAEPLAQAYAGHQFGGFTPSLGDGRALLLGEVIAPDGARFDLQLKGSGPTPYSRRGDGRAAIGPVLREYVISEAMHRFGIPTTRSLAAVATGEWVMREDALPGAVLARVAASHIRVGTFQYFAARNDVEAVRLLAEHAMARHDPAAAGDAQPFAAFLRGVALRQASLVAQWLLVGFVHGVMNTDNMTISGETIDYGPCAFLDAYSPDAVFSSIDHGGRYAFAQQPRIALWNLTRLAECLLPLLAEDEQAAIAVASEALDGFAPAFNRAWRTGLARKLGLMETDDAMADALLATMAAQGADFTRSFRHLDGDARSEFRDPAAFDAWAEGWRARVAAEAMDPAARRAMMQAANPARIPRNHQVERALAAAANDDMAPFEALLDALDRPFEDDKRFAAYEAAPLPAERVTATFCGT